MGHLVLDDNNFKKEVLEAKGLVIVDFYAIWCYPCKMLEPVLEEIENEYKEKIIFGKVDVDQAPVTSHTYEIQGIPSIMFFKDGKMVESLIGVQPKSSYVETIKKYI